MTFSIFSTISILFFETTEGTQLSLEYTTNSFGRLARYTQPLYLQGYLASFTEINSYLKIFTTSFLGAIIFKFIFIFIEKVKFIALLESFGLPVDNEDFIIYLSEVSEINMYKFSSVVIIIYILASWLTKTLQLNKPDS